MRARLSTLSKTVKWGGALLGAAMIGFVAWGDTQWTSVFVTKRWEMGFHHGDLFLLDRNRSFIMGWTAPPPPETFHWLPGTFVRHRRNPRGR